MHQAVKETKPSIEEEWLKKNEIHGKVPIFDMCHAFRYHEIGVDFRELCRNYLSF